MQKSELFPSLPDIQFVNNDPEIIQSRIISAYENASGRTLALSDPVRLFLLAVSDIIIQQRNLIDIAAKNNLIAYAEGSALDHIAALFGVSRLTDEDDESLRERVSVAPDRFSTAGPAKAYEYYAKSAHPDILDVKILTPPDTQPGHVHIYPLMKGGNLPSTEIIDAVFMACSEDTVRPDTDYVEVFAPSVVSYAVNVTYWIRSTHAAMTDTISAAVNQAVDSWVLWQKSELGRDINPSELTARIINAGAKRCVINSPAFTAIPKSAVAVCTSTQITLGGIEDD